MASATLYDDDILTWSEQQAAALRSLARTRPDLTNAVDWHNVIEEIESVGRSEFNAVESLIEQALTHILKAYSDYGSLSRVAWSVETDGFLQQARKRYVPSMRQKLSLETLWQDAFKKSSRELTAYNVSPRPGVPATCPFSLDEIVTGMLSFEDALQRLHQPKPLDGPTGDQS